MQWKAMTVRECGDVIILDLRGNMCLYGEDELPPLVHDLLEKGRLKFILKHRSARRRFAKWRL